jgi:hypothetical protein
VVVDEAAMVPTPRLAELIELAERRGWRLALVGDPMQFSAVGRSGMFGHLVDTLGAVELDRVHRFDASWERDASLRLRRGDTDVVSLYDQHGRLHGGTARQMAMATVHAWRQATDAGESAAMMAPTREAVVVLNDLAQTTRFAAGEVDPHSPALRVGPSGPHAAHLGATRPNDRTLLTDLGRMVKNRDHWTVAAVHRNGSLTVAGPTGRVTLPTEYVAAAVELAYAETSHATQGRTVDRSFLYLDGPTGTSGIYVPLTRGRSTNEAFVVLHDERTAADVVAEAVARTWVDQPATAVRLDRPRATAEGVPAGRGRGRGPKTLPIREPLTEAELRALVKRAVDHQAAADTHHRRLDEHDRSLAALARREAELPELISQAEARLARATQTLEQHDRPLRRRGHAAAIADAKNEAASLPGHIDDLAHELAELPLMIEAEQAAWDRTEVRYAIRHGADAERARGALDDDARIRGERSAEHRTHLLLDHLGPVPDDPATRDGWIAAAGRIDQHRALWDIPDSTLVGPRPSFDQPDYEVTYYAANRAIAELGETVDFPRSTPRRDAPGLSL